MLITTHSSTPSRHGTCPKCTAPLVQSGACAACGWKTTYSIQLEGISIEAKFGPIGTVAEQRSEDGEGRRVDYRPAGGGRSLSETRAEGTYRAELTGHLPRGTAGESHALRVLLAAMEAAGHRVRELPKKKGDDGSGKDARWDIDGNEFSVQIVVMPPDQKLWKELADTGIAVRAGDLDDAVRLVRASLEKKSYWWKGCVLGLDAANLGALPTRELADAYLAAHDDPNVEFGFAQTWIVGPTATSTYKIAITA